MDEHPTSWNGKTLIPLRSVFIGIDRYPYNGINRYNSQIL